MATHQSAKKRARQTEKRRIRNRGVRTQVKSALKRTRTATSSGEATEATTAARQAESVLRRAASKGAIPKKRASRLISRLAKRAASL